MKFFDRIKKNIFLKSKIKKHDDFSIHWLLKFLFAKDLSHLLSGKCLSIFKALNASILKKKKGYVAILLAFAAPMLIYGIKYAIDKSIFTSWSIFKKENDDIYKKCSTAIAYYVASYWNPFFSLEQQEEDLKTVAAHMYSTKNQYS